MKKALLFYRELYYKEVIKKKENFKDCQVIAINLDDNVFFSNLGDNVTFKEPWSYFEFPELAEIDKMALNIAKSWYISENKDLTTYQDISIGEVIQYEIMTYFVAALKSLTLIFKIIKKEKIEEIFLFGKESIYEKAAVTVGEQKNIKVAKFWNESKKEYTEKVNIKKHLKLTAITFLIAFHNMLKRRFLIEKTYSRKNIFIQSSYRFLSLIKKLAENNDFFITIFVTGYIKELFNEGLFRKKNVILVRGFPLRFLFSKDDSKNSLIAKKMYKNLRKNVKNKIERTGILGLWELIKDDFSPFVMNQMSRAMKDYRIVDRYIVKSRTDAIVVGQDFLGVQRLVVALGNTRGIPTMVLQHGGTLKLYPYFVSPISKIVGTWGEKWADWFINLGVRRERIKITGEPYYDDFLENRDNFNRSSFLSRFRIPEGKKIILYAYQPDVTISALSFNMLNEKVSYKICKTVGNVEDYWMIFKLRPGDSLDKGLKIVERSGAKNVVVISKTDNSELLKASDLIITRSSTMAFEGMLLGKPVISLNLYLKWSNEWKLFSKNSGVMEIDKEEDLLSTIERIFEESKLKESLDAGRKEFLKKYFYFPENSSSQKVVECIKTLISG